jgi:hypothetical protein
MEPLAGLEPASSVYSYLLRRQERYSGRMVLPAGVEPASSVYGLLFRRQCRYGSIGGHGQTRTDISSLKRRVSFPLDDVPKLGARGWI